MSQFSAVLTDDGQLLKPSPWSWSSDASMSNTQYSVITQDDSPTQRAVISTIADPPAQMSASAGSDASIPNTQSTLITSQDDPQTQMSLVTLPSQDDPPTQMSLVTLPTQPDPPTPANPAIPTCKRLRLCGKHPRPQNLQPPPPLPPPADPPPTKAAWEARIWVRTKVRDEWIRNTMDSKGLQGTGVSVRMHLRLFQITRMHAHMFAYVSVCVYACLSVCVYVCKHVCICFNACMCVCVLRWMYV